MKTTLHLSDDLVARAKAVALKRGTSLRALVERGLERELDAVEGELLEPLLSRLGEADDEGRKLWEGIRADSYVREQRSGWGE